MELREFIDNLKEAEKLMTNCNGIDCLKCPWGSNPGCKVYKITEPLRKALNKFNFCVLCGQRKKEDDE